MHPATYRAFFDELTKMSSAMKIKSNDRMPARTKANVSALQQHIENWDSPHKEEAQKFVQEVSPEELFDMLHSMRRWYSGQTMGNNLRKHRDVLSGAMRLEPEAALGIYRGFKVPNDNPLAQAKPGETLVLSVTRNKGLSSWTTSQEASNRFSGGGNGKTGLIVRLSDVAGVTPLLAPPSHTKPWFNALYAHAIGKSFRPTEGEYLVAAPEVKVEVVRVKK